MSKRLDEPWARYDRLFFRSPHYKAMPAKWRGPAYLYLLGLSGYSRHMESDGRLSIAEATMVAMEMGYSMRPMLAALEGVGLVAFDGEWVTLGRYAKWNETAEELDDLRTKRIAAGRAGGIAKAIATDLASDLASARPTTSSKPLPEIERELEGELEREESKSSEPKGSSPPVAIATCPPDLDGQQAKELALTMVRLNRERSRSSEITKAWLREAELLLGRDKRPFDEATSLLEWSCRHHFWRKNIWSIPKFREQYARLLLERQDESEIPMPRVVRDQYALDSAWAAVGTELRAREL